MATRALDIVTIMHALSVLMKEIGSEKWNPKNKRQEAMFALLDSYIGVLEKVTGLNAKASRFWEELNAYLVEHGFDPAIQPFDPAMGIGVVSILDKLVKWKMGPGRKVQIKTLSGVKPGFEIPEIGSNVYSVNGFEGSYLVELLTQTDDTLWLFLHTDDTLDGLELAKLSIDVMAAERNVATYSSRSYSPRFGKVHVPMTDFYIKPDLSWILGADTIGTAGYFFIAQAGQSFKFRMDETGARVKVETHMVAMRGGPISEPEVFIIDQPFYGWWTQKGLKLPMASFFADFDAMKQPEGSLESL
jgi:hypothetical protein